jgi:hypothetical protein
LDVNDSKQGEREKSRGPGDGLMKAMRTEMKMKWKNSIFNALISSGKKERERERAANIN